MALKSTVKMEQPTRLFYPCLRRSIQGGNVILFTAKTAGTVVHSDDPDYELGYHSAMFAPADEEGWEPVKSVTIEEV